MITSIMNIVNKNKTEHMNADRCGNTRGQKGTQKKQNRN